MSGLYVLVIASEQLARAAQPRLDLVGEQQHVVGAANLGRSGQIAVRGNQNSRFALDRLHQKCASVLRDDGFQRRGVPRKG